MALMKSVPKIREVSPKRWARALSPLPSEWATKVVAAVDKPEEGR